MIRIEMAIDTGFVISRVREAEVVIRINRICDML